MTLTYYGHSCFGLFTGTHHLVFDPFITPNALAKDIRLEQIPADFILVSHGHADHLADLVPLATRTGATVVGCWELHSWAQHLGIATTHPMNTGGSWSFPFGRVQMVNAVHSSSGPEGQYLGQPAGFVIQLPERTIYYSGDTALHMDMQLIAHRHRIDLALLCLGDNFTMDYHDAAQAAQWVGCRRVVGMHYDTFPYIQLDHAAARTHFHEKGLELTLMTIGTTLEV